MTDAFAFGSPEEMNDWLLHRPVGGYPQQQALTFGSTWFTYLDGLSIFGVIPMPAVFVSAELGAGATHEESLISLREFTAKVKQGRLWSRAFSVRIPDGEWGGWDHTAVWPIEKKWYDEAKRNGWNADAVSLPCAINIHECFTALRGGSA